MRSWSCSYDGFQGGSVSVMPGPLMTGAEELSSSLPQPATTSRAMKTRRLRIDPDRSQRHPPQRSASPRVLMDMRGALMLAAACLVPAAAALAAAPAAPQTVLASVSSTGVQGDRDSVLPALSG